MFFLKSLWRMVTEPALEQATGKFESAFFETVYRVTYASGLSFSNKPTLLYRLYSNIIKVMIVLFLTSELWHLFSIISSSLDVIIENINVTVIHIIVAYRYKSMMDCKAVYKKLATSMESPYFDVSTLGRKKIYEYWLKLQQRYFRILIIIAICTLSIWYVYPLVDDIEYNFVVAVRLPIEYQSTNRYIIVYLVILLMFHYISCFVVVNDLIMQANLMHFLCQFAILSDCFKNIIPDCSADFKGYTDIELFANKKFWRIYFERLGNLVEQHKIILNHGLELRKILSAPMLGQLLASGTLICLAGYQVTASMTVSIVKFIMSLLYLSYNLFTFYVFCRWCDEIKMQSELISDAVYASGWERIGAVPGVRSRLLVIMARAHRPLILTAGGIYDLSLMSYTTLVKTSYSALTVLLRVRQRN